MGEIGRKEGNVLINDALNTFYLQLYDIRHMIKDHLDFERGNPLPPHGLLFPISSKFFFISPSHRQDNTYHSLCYPIRGALAGTGNHSMGEIYTDRNNERNTHIQRTNTHDGKIIEK